MRDGEAEAREKQMKRERKRQKRDRHSPETRRDSGEWKRKMESKQREGWGVRWRNGVWEPGDTKAGGGE